MGYRSDICIIFDAGSEENMNVLMLWYDNYKGGIEQYGFEHNFKIHSHVIHFEATDVKWYDSYADVTFIEGMYKDFTKTLGDTPDYNYEYIRIGEDTLDIEEECGGDGFNYLSVGRSIDISF